MICEMKCCDALTAAQQAICETSWKETRDRQFHSMQDYCKSQKWHADAILVEQTSPMQTFVEAARVDPMRSYVEPARKETRRDKHKSFVWISESKENQISRQTTKTTFADKVIDETNFLSLRRKTNRCQRYFQKRRPGVPRDFSRCQEHRQMTKRSCSSCNSHDHTSAHRVTITQLQDSHFANVDLYFLEQITMSRNKFSRTSRIVSIYSEQAHLKNKDVKVEREIIWSQGRLSIVSQGAWALQSAVKKRGNILERNQKTHGINRIIQDRSEVRKKNGTDLQKHQNVATAAELEHWSTVVNCVILESRRQQVVQAAVGKENILKLLIKAWCALTLAYLERVLASGDRKRDAGWVLRGLRAWCG